MLLHALDFVFSSTIKSTFRTKYFQRNDGDFTVHMVQKSIKISVKKNSSNLFFFNNSMLFKIVWCLYFHNSNTSVNRCVLNKMKNCSKSIKIMQTKNKIYRYNLLYIHYSMLLISFFAF